ncbi:MAG: hypothetical protein ACKPJF_21995 [Dolichospermum sp.]
MTQELETFLQEGGYLVMTADYFVYEIVNLKERLPEFRLGLDWAGVLNTGTAHLQ